jgi:hypothetical protein
MLVGHPAEQPEASYLMIFETDYAALSFIERTSYEDVGCHWESSPVSLEQVIDFVARDDSDLNGVYYWDRKMQLSVVECLPTA